MPRHKRNWVVIIGMAAVLVVVAITASIALYRAHSEPTKNASSNTGVVSSATPTASASPSEQASPSPSADDLAEDEDDGSDTGAGKTAAPASKQPPKASKTPQAAGGAVSGPVEINFAKACSQFFGASQFTFRGGDPYSVICITKFENRTDNIGIQEFCDATGGGNAQHDGLNWNCSGRTVNMDAACSWRWSIGSTAITPPQDADPRAYYWSCRVPTGPGFDGSGQTLNDYCAGNYGQWALIQAKFDGNKWVCTRP